MSITIHTDSYEHLYLGGGGIGLRNGLGFGAINQVMSYEHHWG